MQNYKHILIGGGGHAQEVYESIILNNEEIYLVISNEKNIFFEKKILDEKIFFEKYNKKLSDFKFTLCVGDINKRIHLINNYSKKGKIKFESVIHPDASISQSSLIKNGCFIAKNSSVNSNVKIESNCIINTGSIIEHDCYIGENCHIAPGSILLGNVKIGNNTFIGSNSVIKEGVRIGDNVIIGAGSVVLSDIESNLKVVGNPAKKILNNE